MELPDFGVNVGDWLDWMADWYTMMNDGTGNIITIFLMIIVGLIGFWGLFALTARRGSEE